MGLVRLLILAALIWLVWRILRNTLLAAPGKNPANDSRPDSQKMVRCAWCGVHSPEALAVRQENLLFCCEEHRQQWLENKHD
jgi:uncharacterized protein